MVKDKAKEHGLEYVILKSDQEEQLWEIDYDRGLSLNVSEYMSLKNINSQNYNVTRYYGRIEDFLKEERSCINIHYHESVACFTSSHKNSHRKKRFRRYRRRL